MNHKEENQQSWTSRIKATHNKPDGIRFVAGELVILSRKNTASGKLPYFVETHELSEFDKTKKPTTDLRIAKAGDLDRGTPILLIENPKEVMVAVKPANHYTMGMRVQKYTLFFNKKKKHAYKSWLIKFILDGKMHRMYLTKSQYHHELVRAVPARIKKNYDPKKEAVREAR